jgi:hypothetical protein
MGRSCDLIGPAVPQICDGEVRATELWWGSENAESWRTSHGAPDCIVGADLIYDISSTEGAPCRSVLPPPGKNT